MRTRIARIVVNDDVRTVLCGLLVAPPAPPPQANAAEYHKERQARAVGGFDPARVVAVLRAHDEERCLVMPRADRNLDQAIRSERFAGPCEISFVLILLENTFGRQTVLSCSRKLSRPPALIPHRLAGLDVPRVVAIARDLALALQEMHGKGWVHADVKPRNIVRIGGRWCVQTLKAALIRKRSLCRGLSVLNAIRTRTGPVPTMSEGERPSRRSDARSSL